MPNQATNNSNGKATQKRVKNYTKEEAELAHSEIIDQATGPIGPEKYPSKLKAWKALGHNMHTDVNSKNLGEFFAAEFHRVPSAPCIKTTLAFVSAILMHCGQPAFNKATYHMYPEILKARESILKNPKYTKQTHTQFREFEDEDCILLLQICYALYFKQGTGWTSHNDEAVQIAAVIILCTYGSFRGDDLNYIHCCDVEFYRNPKTKKSECKVAMVNRHGESNPKNGVRRPEAEDGEHRIMICIFVCSCVDLDVDQTCLMTPLCGVHVLKMMMENLPESESNRKILRNRNKNTNCFTCSNMGERSLKKIAQRMNDLLPYPYPDAQNITLKSLKRNGITNKLTVTDGNEMKVAHTTRHLTKGMVKVYNKKADQRKKDQSCREVSTQLNKHYADVQQRMNKDTEFKQKLAEEVKDTHPDLHRYLTEPNPFDTLLDDPDFEEIEQKFVESDEKGKDAMDNNRALVTYQQPASYPSAPDIPSSSCTNAPAPKKPRFDVMMKPKVSTATSVHNATHVSSSNTFTKPNPVTKPSVTTATNDQPSVINQTLQPAAPFTQSQRHVMIYKNNPDNKNLGREKRPAPSLAASMNKPRPPYDVQSGQRSVVPRRTIATVPQQSRPNAAVDLTDDWAVATTDPVPEPQSEVEKLRNELNMLKKQKEEQELVQQLREELMATKNSMSHNESNDSSSATHNNPRIQDTTTVSHTPLTSTALELLPVQQPQYVHQNKQNHQSVPHPQTMQQFSPVPYTHPSSQHTTPQNQLAPAQNHFTSSFNQPSTYRDNQYAMVPQNQIPTSNQNGFNGMTPEVFAAQQQLQLQQLLQMQAQQQQQFLQHTQTNQRQQQDSTNGSTSMKGCTVTINHYSNSH